MSMIRSGPNVRHYRVAAVSLGLLAVLLLTVDIGLGVYCKSAPRLKVLLKITGSLDEKVEEKDCMN